MTTRLKKEASDAIVAWCKKNDVKILRKPRHVHPQVYVIGHAASACLIVAKCWADSEPQTKDWNKKYTLDIVHMFDESLKAGDWCTTGYVVTQGYQQTVAIPLQYKAGGKSK